MRAKIAFILLQISSFFLWLQAVSINEFLKPAEGERYHAPGGRGRGRGRGRGYTGANTTSNVEAAPPIEDRGHFPTLGGK